MKIICARCGKIRIIDDKQAGYYKKWNKFPKHCAKCNAKVNRGGWQSV